MKNIFKEFSFYSVPEIQKIWENAFFIFDTSSLLNLYRYSKDTSDKHLEILTKIKDRKQIWSPYHVIFEYHKNRINVISDLEKSYNDIISNIKVLNSKINEIKGKLKGTYRLHPLINID
jgi:hypothetical protein